MPEIRDDALLRCISQHALVSSDVVVVCEQFRCRRFSTRLVALQVWCFDDGGRALLLHARPFLTMRPRLRCAISSPAAALAYHHASAASIGPSLLLASPSITIISAPQARRRLPFSARHGKRLLRARARRHFARAPPAAQANAGAAGRAFDVAGHRRRRGWARHADFGRRSGADARFVSLHDGGCRPRFAVGGSRRVSTGSDDDAGRRERRAAKVRACRRGELSAAVTISFHRAGLSIAGDAGRLLGAEEYRSSLLYFSLGGRKRTRKWRSA